MVNKSWLISELFVDVDVCGGQIELRISAARVILILNTNSTAASIKKAIILGVTSTRKRTSSDIYQL